ncbi:MAG: GAF domain-containing protein [Haloferacaceae archaeon]
MDESIRVLHVDDDADFAGLAATFLEREDDRFDVTTAADADEALDRLAEGAFDCVVSDYEMPGRDGIEFLEAVREGHPDLPFVLYTGRGSEEIASEAISAGVTDYIQKGGGTDQYTVLANRVANAVEAYRTRRRAARHERINELIRNISRELVEAETVDDIERTVCEAMAGSEPYRFAWIGEPDPEGEIVARTSAGDADDYLDEVTIRHDDSPEARGPAGRAVRTGEVQVVQRIEEDASFEPWRDVVDRHGYGSVVVLPLAYDDTLHGILAIYSDQAYAFDETERQVLVELGDTISEALRAAETRRRLEERERELARGQSLLEAQQEAIIDGMLIIDESGDVVSYNDRFVELWDVSDRRVETGDDGTMLDWVVERVADPEAFRERVEYLYDHPEATAHDEIRLRDGRVFERYTTPVVGDDGTNYGRLWTFRDVTERKERERELRRYERMVNGMREAACIYDADGRFVLVNEYLAEFHGTDRDDLEGELSELVPRIREEANGDPYRELLDGEREELHGEVEMDFANRGRAVIDYRLTPVRIDGETEGVVGVARDVTDRKRRERAIEGLHRATRDLLRADTREAVAEITADAARAILDYPASVVRLIEDGEHLVPAAATTAAHVEMDERPAYPVEGTLAGKAYRTGNAVVEEDLSRVDDGHDRGTARSAMYLPIGTHGVISVADADPGTFDRTDADVARILAANAAATLDRIERERRFREMEARNRVVVDNFPDGGVFLFDEDLRYTLAGGDELERVGLTSESFEGATPFDLFPEGIATELAAYYRRALDGEEHTFTQRYEGNDYRIQTLPVRDDEGRIVAGMAVSKNVTDRRRRQETIRELHRVTRDLFRADSPEEIAERVAKAAFDTLDYEYNVARLVNDDGTRLHPVSIAQGPDEMWSDRPPYPVGKEPVGEAFETGETLVYEDVGDIDDDVDRADARAGMYLPIGEYGVLSVNDPAAGVFDETDVQLAEIVTASAAVALERLERMSDLERQNERLEEFTDVVSHDLRNPLNVAEGRLELAREECDCPYLDDVADAHGRMQTLIDDLLTFARTGRRVNEAEPIALADFVEDCWRTVATGGATLSVESERVIQADPNRLRQLLENLFRNSVEHGSTSSRPQADDGAEHASTDGRVRSDGRTGDAPDRRTGPLDDGEADLTADRPGDDVTVTVGDLRDGFYVEDDGPGIPEADRERIFESGYSTSESGTGFGLAIVKQIVDAQGWEVRVTEGGDGGARFEITGVEPLS